MRWSLRHSAAEDHEPASVCKTASSINRADAKSKVIAIATTWAVCAWPILPPEPAGIELKSSQTVSSIKGLHWCINTQCSNALCNLESGLALQESVGHVEPTHEQDAEQPITQARQLAAEALGTAFLLATVVGSGIMGDRLADGSGSLALLACTLATGAGLAALILTFGPVSGAHFNPAVTLSEAWLGNTRWRAVAPYIVAQIAGAFIGVAAAHLMFGEPIFFVSQHVRTGPAQWWSEFVATFGLVAVIIGCSRSRPGVTPFAVAAYIVAACWFTASTSFANPAVTLARAVSDTYVGIRPLDAPGFIVAQIAGAMLSGCVLGWLYPRNKR